MSCAILDTVIQNVNVIFRVNIFFDTVSDNFVSTKQGHSRSKAKSLPNTRRSYVTVKQSSHTVVLETVAKEVLI